MNWQIPSYLKRPACGPSIYLDVYDLKSRFVILPQAGRLHKWGKK